MNDTGSVIEMHGGQEWVISWAGSIGSAKPVDLKCEGRVSVVGNLVKLEGAVPRSAVESVFEKATAIGSARNPVAHAASVLVDKIKLVAAAAKQGVKTT